MTDYVDLPKMPIGYADAVRFLLRAVFVNDINAANEWLTTPSGKLHGRPVDVLAGDSRDVARVVTYLRRSVP